MSMKQGFVKFWFEILVCFVDVNKATRIFSNSKTDISVQNLIHLYTITFMYFFTTGRRRPSEIEKCNQTKDITLTNRTDGNSFLWLLHLTQLNDKRQRF